MRRAAWTEAEHLARWWGPKGFPISVVKLDLRSGGVFLYSMRFPEGHEMWGKFVYREIAEPGRLVFINSFSDAEGGVTRHPLSPTWPLEVLSTVTFAEHDGKTTVTLKGIPVNATELEIKTFEDGYPSMQQGFSRTLDKLAAYLERLDTNRQPAQEHVMHLNPYLHFNGRCEEAFKFYEQVLGGKIVVMVRHEGTPAAEHTPAEWRTE